MRVPVLGSGVIGTASAYYLARAGFEVVVVDRQNGPTLETSFANAGQVSPGYASPWAAQGVPLKAIKWAAAGSTRRWRSRPPPISTSTCGWRRCCATVTARYAVNKERMVRLSEYSRDCLDELRAETGIAYEGRQLGHPAVPHPGPGHRGQGHRRCWKPPASLRAAPRPRRHRPRQAGPGRVRTKLAGALRLPNDQTGDCQMFTSKLADG